MSSRRDFGTSKCNLGLEEIPICHNQLVIASMGKNNHYHDHNHQQKGGSV